MSKKMKMVSNLVVGDRFETIGNKDEAFILGIKQVSKTKRLIHAECITHLGDTYLAEILLDVKSRVVVH